LSALKVGILVYEQVDLLDVGGPYEVFLTASRLAVRNGQEPPFEVVTVAWSVDSVAAYGGLRLLPQATLEAASPFDVFIVPGTISVDRVLGDGELLAALRPVVEASELVASVCTGAFVLGKLGQLEGRPWTTHWEDVDELATRFPGSGTGAPWVRWVDAGSVVSSGGLSSGIAMSLHLVDRLAGRDLAVRTARQLEYEWDPEPAGSR
jgi:transcriptional regulator GlxA family with amidase domain